MLSKLEWDTVKPLLDKHGVSPLSRASYRAFAYEIKGKKGQIRDDIKKVIEKRKQEGLDEELLKKIAKIVSPELLIKVTPQVL